MPNSNAFEASRRRNLERRRAFIKRWAAYVRSHDDAEWSRQQNTLIDAQLQSANELAADGETDPVAFFERMDGRRSRPR